MKKIKIVFDATIITSVRNDMKFGIFNVAKNLLIEFMKRNDVEIRLFSRELNKKLAFDNLKKYKHERQISYKDAIDICREYLHPHTYLKNKTLIQLLLRYIHPVRPDRKVPRKTRRSRRFTPFTHRIA